MLFKTLEFRSQVGIITLAMAFAVFANGLGFGNPICKASLGDDVFESSKDILNDLLQLKLEDNRLILDRAHWQNVIQQSAGREMTRRLLGRNENQDNRLFPLNRGGSSEPIQIFGLFVKNAQVGNRIGGGGSTVSGGGNASADFRSESIESRIETRGNRFAFSIVETIGQNRSLRIVEDTDFHLQITVSDDSLDQLLVIKQSKDRLVIVFLKGEEILTATPKNYSELLDNDPESIAKKALLFLTEVGFSMPLDANSPSVKKVLLEQISLRTSPLNSESSKLIEQLASEKFIEREEALESLKNEFENHQAAIDRSLRGSTLLPEVRVRLERLVNDIRLLNQAEYEVIEGQKLLENIPYLVGMFQFTDPKQAELLGRYLGELTSQNFGSDANAWQSWLANPSEDDPISDD